MRALVLEAPGGGLRLEEVPVPEPRDGEVLVKVTSCGVCHTDLHVIKGETAFPTPAVLGHEISGVVERFGSGVEGIEPGRRVVASFIMPCGSCRYCVRGRDDVCERFFSLNRLRGVLYDGESRLRRADGSPLAMYSMGGLAEYAVVPATDVFPLPEGLPAEESAILGCAVFTAYGAVRHGADLRAGESVAVVAMGGVGSNIVHIASAFGASRVIAVDVVGEKLEGARELGATETVNASESDPVERVREITGGEGVDVSFEALGRPETFAQALGMIRDGGRMVAVGIAPGESTAAVPITQLVRRSQRIVGSYGARTRADFPDILGLAGRGFINPQRTVTRKYQLEEAARAYEDLDRGEIRGRAVVVV
ncbi:zinc-binding dehydrogenase [Rubrobacter calidifluminis]|uniref:zinc-binding dehydrogenase n=1 Tax=Rubrobacter calidifluminis TaxID=1392640 RepID=UPI003B5A1D4F